MELKAEKENAEVRVDNVEEYQKVVDAEWNILYEKLDLIVKSGAKVVLSKLPIGDVATQVMLTILEKQIAPLMSVQYLVSAVIYN